jgi:membrane-bound ClpP family serine protease
MDQIIEYLYVHPVIAVAVGIIVLIGFFFLLKTFFRLAIVSALILVIALTAWHFYSSSGRFETRMKSAVEKTKSQAQSAAEKGKDILVKQGKRISEGVEEKAGKIKQDLGGKIRKE